MYRCTLNMNELLLYIDAQYWTTVDSKIDENRCKQKIRTTPGNG